VVSRGYGGQVSGLKQVQKNDSAELVGDEPLMIQQKTKVPVVVGADRVAAVNYLLENNQCDIVLSDDGLQHYRMQRDVEIAVLIRAEIWKWFLPACRPLRERVSRLNEVDIVVFNGPALPAGDCSYTLKIIDLFQLNTGERLPLSAFTERAVHAMAGIGHPPRFFTQLRDSGISLTEHAFSDHHAYQQADFSGWQNECIIMTEKDAVKCRHLRLPDAWVVSVIADLSESLESQLHSKILSLLDHQSNQ